MPASRWEFAKNNANVKRAANKQTFNWFSNEVHTGRLIKTVFSRLRWCSWKCFRRWFNQRRWIVNFWQIKQQLLLEYLYINQDICIRRDVFAVVVEKNRQHSNGIVVVTKRCELAPNKRDFMTTMMQLCVLWPPARFCRKKSTAPLSHSAGRTLSFATDNSPCSRFINKSFLYANNFDDRQLEA